MSLVSPVFHTVVTVSWSQRLTKDDDIHSITTTTTSTLRKRVYNDNKKQHQFY